MIDSLRRRVAVAWIVSLALAAPAQAGLRIALVGDQGDDEPPSPMSCFENERQPLACLGEALARIQASRVPGAFPYDLLLLLGDNFYPRGLNQGAWEAKRDAVLAHFRGLVPPENVHAIAGNHDYYQFHVTQPFGFTTIGNSREKAIADWTYHYWWPEEAVYEIAPGARVQIVFFDSARVVALGARDARESLEALTALLRARAGDPSVRWRLLAMHHPLRSVGHHGNYGRSCDSWPWLERHLPPLAIQDACSDRYREYVDAVTTAIRASGARVQLVASGHEHSLQLLGLAEPAPAVQIVSGAATEAMRVPPADPAARVYTTVSSPGPNGLGVSEYGFAEITLDADAAVVGFRRSQDAGAAPLAASCAFRVDPDGGVRPEPCGR